MMFQRTTIFLTIIVGILLAGCRVKLEPVELLTFKQQIEQLFPDAEVLTVDVDSTFSKGYQLKIKQPLDHKNKEKGTFDQVIRILHKDEGSPVIFTLKEEVYSLPIEMTEILRGNQIIVVGRDAFKDSIPSEYISEQQIAEDCHRIVSKLKRLYAGKWISVGTGENANQLLRHRSIYPWDVKVTIAYNPNIISREVSIREFLENKGKEILYIYDENKSDIMKSLQIKHHVDALKVVSPNATIKQLAKKEQKRVYDKLQNWLGYSVELYPLSENN